jgi:hypothetical protein
MLLLASLTLLLEQLLLSMLLGVLLQKLETGGGRGVIEALARTRLRVSRALALAGCANA